MRFLPPSAQRSHCPILEGEEEPVKIMGELVSMVTHRPIAELLFANSDSMHARVLDVGRKA